MTDTRNSDWYVQNRMYQLKERKKIIERFIQTVQKERDEMNNFSPLKRYPEDTLIQYILIVAGLIISRLDMLVGFYIFRFRANRIFRKALNELAEVNSLINESNKGGLYED